MSITQTKQLVDQMLESDISGLTIMIVGAAGTGKTTFCCMQLPLYYIHQLKQSGNLSDRDYIQIVNTDNSLLNKRFIEVCKAFGYDYKDVRKHFKFETLQNFSRQHSYITNILPRDVQRGNCKMIVVDPLNHHLRQEFSKAPPEKRLNVAGRLMPQMDYQMKILNDISRQYNIPVVVTLFPKKAHSESIPNAWHNAYFGSLEIGHLSDVVCWMVLNKSSRGIVDCGVLKHRLKPTPFYLHVSIQNFGLALVGSSHQP